MLVLVLGLVWWARYAAQAPKVDERTVIAQFLELEPDAFQMSSGYYRGSGQESFIVTVVRPHAEADGAATLFPGGETIDMVVEVKRGYVLSAKVRPDDFREFRGEPIGMERAQKIASEFVTKHYPLPEVVPTLTAESGEEERVSDTPPRRGAWTVTPQSSEEERTSGRPVLYVLWFGGRKGEARTGNNAALNITAQGRIVYYLAQVAPRQNPPPPVITSEQALHIASEHTPAQRLPNYRIEFEKPQLVLSWYRSPSGGPIWEVGHKSWIYAPGGPPGSPEDGWYPDFGGGVTIDALTGRVLPLKIKSP
jgi:hypothetical protein